MRIMLAILTPALAAAMGATGAASAGTFGDDLAFLKGNTEIVVLSDASGNAQVAIAPAYQGRVMTSTATGAAGLSFGWINRELIASKQAQPHISPWGGEDRFWMGPEGGQFAIFFSKGAAFDLEHWQTPPVIDTEAYDLVSKTQDSAVFRKTAHVTNWSGTRFDVQIDRSIRLLSAEDAGKLLGVALPPAVKLAAFESDNKVTNAGLAAWTKETGLLSIWILGMFNPTPSTTIAIPFEAGSEAQLGPKVNDAYFGKVPADRLVVKDNVLFFSGDGQYRSKIGISPRRAKPFAGSYDAGNRVLTIVQYSKPAGATDYVNSMWEMQKEPFAGDTVNSYNDGPPAPGKKPLGPFYELETSSPALVLAPDASASHIQRTFHIQGEEKDLDPIARATLGASLAEIKGALK